MPGLVTPQIRASVEEANTIKPSYSGYAAVSPQIRASVEEANTTTSPRGSVSLLTPQIRASVEEANTLPDELSRVGGRGAANTRLRGGGEHTLPSRSASTSDVLPQIRASVEEANTSAARTVGGTGRRRRKYAPPWRRRTH